MEEALRRSLQRQLCAIARTCATAQRLNDRELAQRGTVVPADEVLTHTAHTICTAEGATEVSAAGQGASAGAHFPCVSISSFLLQVYSSYASEPF